MGDVPVLTLLNKLDRLPQWLTISGGPEETMYQPDPGAVPTLGGAAPKLAAAAAIPNNFHPAPNFIGKLESGEIFFDSSLELDTDGWPDGEHAGDPDWQPDTSLRLPDHSSLDANTIPYFVLPLPPSWPAQFGIQLGDYAAVVFGQKLAFAIFGDRGPRTKIGEGSIALLRRLGEERIRPDGTVRNAGMGPRVITIVFPGSGDLSDRMDQRMLVEAIDQKGSNLFNALK
jgi:Fungal chitosanase of glycosyl hydrolase group 75